MRNHRVESQSRRQRCPYHRGQPTVTVSWAGVREPLANQPGKPEDPLRPASGPGPGLEPPATDCHDGFVQAVSRQEDSEVVSGVSCWQ